ncbi:hypothetical protein AB4090_13825 [Acidithiobacillus sp. IBUN Pt1247-S3]|uniref:hypothetical protein n=1 Tax=Acidithiobacillus sp. IBUN Pt1247-S3 TaxID=3166642 RepID=UPI0034E425F8
MTIFAVELSNSGAPLLISTVLVLFVQRQTLYPASTPLHSGAGSSAPIARSHSLFLLLLVAATLYGFSFYNLGYPILTATGSHPSTLAFAAGVGIYVVYLGISALSGYTLGVQRLSPLRPLWLLGYLPSALGSAFMALSVLLGMPELAYYGAVAILGLGMGAVETFEPTLVSALVKSNTLSRGMGFLSVSRSIGQLISNLVMGFLFTVNPASPYLYAFVASLLATVVLMGADLHYGHKMLQIP